MYLRCLQTTVAYRRILDYQVQRRGYILTG